MSLPASTAIEHAATADQQHAPSAQAALLKAGIVAACTTLVKGGPVTFPAVRRIDAP